MLFQGFSFAPHPPPGSFKHPVSWDELKPAIYISWFSWFINPQHMSVVSCCIQLYSYNMIRIDTICLCVYSIYIYIHTHLYFTYTYPVDIPCPSISSSQVYIGPAMLRALRWGVGIVIDKNRDLCTWGKNWGSTIWWFNIAMENHHFL